MPDEEKNQDMAICPCCGERTLKRPVKVDGKIIDDYLASIMTGVPFSHTFNMFDGRLKITCGLADRDTGVMFWRFIHFMEPHASDTAIVKDLLGLINTYCAVKRIEVTGSGNMSKLYTPCEILAAACQKFLDEWELVTLTDETKKDFLKAVSDLYDQLKPTDVISSVPPTVLNRVNNDFRALESIMLQAGFDENFWKGIKLG